MKRIMFLTAALAVTALVLAACSNNSTTAPPAAGGSITTSAPATSGTTVKAVDNASFGKILTDGDGNVLYLYEQDQGTTTACTTSCLSTWPPLTASGTPTAGSGVNQSMLGTAKQADGTVQVTYNGHLVYLFTGDTAPGQVNGEGLEGFWVVSAAGDPVKQPMAGGSSSSSGGGYSYH
jgi:predicted lipoprotein with Yx(FWY)xxD motif